MVARAEILGTQTPTRGLPLVMQNLAVVAVLVGRWAHNRITLAVRFSVLAAAAQMAWLVAS